MMATIEESIEELLNGIPDSSTLRPVVQNILYEPIPDAVKKRLLKPLLPRIAAPPRKRKLEKLLQEFDPLHPFTKRKLGVNRSELQSVVKLMTLPGFVLRKEVGMFKDYSASFPVGHRLQPDALTCLNAMGPCTTALITNELRGLNDLKFSLVLNAELEKLTTNAEPDTTQTTAHFRSNATPIINSGDISQAINKAGAQILEKIEKFTNGGSGWRLNRCESLDLSIVQYQPFRGKSYFKTPSYIPPRTVINVKNEDNRCFEWAVLSALYPVAHNSDRTMNYRDHLGELNFAGIEFPVKITDINKFERLNQGLSINVFGWKSGLYPLHVSKQVGQEVDLLLLSNPNDPTKTHYMWIKDLARMLHKNSRHEHRKHPCRKCLHVFSTEALLANHKNDCQGIGEKPQRIVMPNDGEILEFVNHQRQMRVPYIIYADFEALNIPVEGCTNNPGESHTREIAKQIPCSYCYVVVRSDGVAKDPVLYRGENAAEHFLESLQTEMNEIREFLQKPADMRMTEKDHSTFDNAVDCHICGELLNGDRVRDHCHITGKFRGAAHNACNLKLRIYPGRTKVPVVFHNLRGYDGHLIMSALGATRATKGQKIRCIPNNMEKYMTFSVGQLQFIDSLQFMNSSLEKLAANLQTEDLIISGRNISDEKLSLLRRKGVYPYEYVDKLERFDEPSLPPKEAFYSQLSREHVSVEDYQHAQNVWSKLGCKTLGDYHDIYLRTDVLPSRRCF